MKNYLFYCVLISIFTQCAPSNEFKVEGTVDMKDASQVFVIKAGDDNRPEPIDTLEVLEGKFSFAGEIEIPEMHYLFFEGIRGNLPFVLENGTIFITANKDSLFASTVKGTPSNKDLTDYFEGSRKYGKDLNRIQVEMRSPDVFGDSLALADLKEQFDAMIEKLTQYELDFISSQSNSYVSALILERMVMNQSIETEEAVELYSSFSDKVKQTKSAKSIQKVLFPEVDNSSEPAAKPETSDVSSLAPDFTAPNPDGNQISLREVASKGKITLIEFWASWCKPCRIENPAIVSMYQKYNDKGLNIIGVSLDRNAENWKEAIQADNLDWDHVSNLKYWQDPIAKLYNVNSIPNTFIVDQNLNIISSGLRGNELEAKVAELLAL